MKKISVIIPVYNEDKYVQEIVKAVVKSKVEGYCKEIIIVDDGSFDKTPNILKKLQKNHKKTRNCDTLKIIYKSKNEGKGAALREGMRYSTGEIIITQDADLEYNPEEYKLLLRSFKNKKTTVVYGSRTLGRRKYHNNYSSFIFYVGGQMLTHFINFLFRTKLTDQPTGYKLFRKSLIPLLIKDTNENGFAFEVAMTAILVKNQNTIKEIPITYKPRNIKEGKKINFSDFIRSMYVAVKYRFN